jgi:ABC-type glycerol-3-phosphate transport system substrate-binding protein
MRCNQLSTFILALSFLFLGCENDTSRQENTLNKSNTEIHSTGNKIKLRWLAQWYGDGAKEKYIREMVREFSLLNQDIEIQLDFPQKVIKSSNVSNQFAAINDTIINMTKTGNWPWDVFLCDKTNYLFVGTGLGDPNWGKEYLVDFSQKDWFVNAHQKGLLTDKFKSDYGGIVPGPVIEGVSNILFVSSEVEKLLGISVKRTDMNFSDFLSYAKAIKKYNETHSQKLTFLFAQDVNPELLFSQLLTSSYGKQTPATRQEAMDAFTESYQALELLAQNGAYEQYTEIPGANWDVKRRILIDNKFLFNLQPTWMYQIWNNSNPKGLAKMSPCEMPSFDNKKSPFYSQIFQVVFCVPKASKNREAAERLMKFIATSNNAETWTQYAKCPTGLKTAISVSDFGQGEYQRFFGHIEKKYGHNQTPNITDLFFSTNKTIDYKFLDVYNGKISANEALRNLERQIR